jgi:hypothetical protein
MTFHAAMEIRNTLPELRPLISGWIREQSIRGRTIGPIFSSDFVLAPGDERGHRVSEILSSYLPQSVPQRIDRALQNVARGAPRPGRTMPVSDEELYLFFAADVEELAFVLRALSSRGLIFGFQSTLPAQIGLTADGWQRVSELEAPRIDSRQAFVAMAFAPELDAAWHEGFFKAVDACRFLPVRVDKKEHNDKICDVITQEIRKSHFVIADVTLHRQGVYFEAGYAMGLGLPVIWSCRTDALENCHFDTRQYSHVVWSSPDELRNRLQIRIAATITSID